MGHLCGDPDITTIGLLGYADQAREAIFKQHPELKSVGVPDWDDLGIGWSFFSREERGEVIKEWVEALYSTYGEYLMLEPASEVNRKSDLEVIAEVKGISTKEALDRTVIVVVDNSTNNQ